MRNQAAAELLCINVLWWVLWLNMGKVRHNRIYCIHRLTRDIWVSCVLDSEWEHSGEGGAFTIRRSFRGISFTQKSSNLCRNDAMRAWCLIQLWNIISLISYTPCTVKKTSQVIRMWHWIWLKQQHGWQVAHIHCMLSASAQMALTSALRCPTKMAMAGTRSEVVAKGLSKSAERLTTIELLISLAICKNHVIHCPPYCPCCYCFSTHWQT